MVAERRHEDDVGVQRVHANLRDVLRLDEADVRPRLAGIRRLVHAVARRDVAADFALAGADIHDVRIPWRDSHGADRRARDLTVGHRTPGGAAVHRFPQAAAGGAEVVLERPGHAAGDRNRTAAAIRSDVAPAQRAERSRRIGRARAGASAALRRDGPLDDDEPADEQQRETQPYSVRRS